MSAEELTPMVGLGEFFKQLIPVMCCAAVAMWFVFSAVGWMCSELTLGEYLSRQWRSFLSFWGVR